MIRCLRDIELGLDRRDLLRRLELHATPTLVAALKELSNDKELGVYVPDAIRHMEFRDKTEEQ